MLDSLNRKNFISVIPLKETLKVFDGVFRENHSQGMCQGGMICQQFDIWLACVIKKEVAYFDNLFFVRVSATLFCPQYPANRITH
jgi:hypothetical protein